MNPINKKKEFQMGYSKNGKPESLLLVFYLFMIIMKSFLLEELICLLIEKHFWKNLVC